MDPALAEDNSDEFVTPPSISTVIEEINLYTSHARPVLLCGPVGCGKSAFLRFLGRNAGRSRPPEFISIQISKDTDGRALLGSYHCTEVAGEFKWLPGPLTVAVMNSSWLILEDIDSAPPDVISIILPLVQHSKLEVTEVGKTFVAQAGFRLFATFRTTSSVTNQSADMLLLNHFKMINMTPLSVDELLQIPQRMFPNLSGLFGRLLAVYDKICQRSPEEPRLSRQIAAKSFSQREFLKMCRRINSYFVPSSMAQIGSVFKDIFAIFCAFIPDPSLRLYLAKELGSLLHISNPEVSVFLNREPPICILEDAMTIGRVTLSKMHRADHENLTRKDTFTLHASAKRLLEVIATSVSVKESCLLVGETGTGKTSVVQYLAQTLRKELHVINLSHQSETSDLLGGYKPVDIQQSVNLLRDPFLELFSATFSKKSNSTFISTFLGQYLAKNWDQLVKTMRFITTKVLNDQIPAARGREKLRPRWVDFSSKLSFVEKQLSAARKTMVFGFLEGTIIRAYRHGDWVLLDEVNLANPELLSALTDLLDQESHHLLLTERGDLEPIPRHPDFRLFACMNPSTDVGKRDLPPSIRSRFTEIYCDELSEPNEVRMLTREYLGALAEEHDVVEKAVELYFKLKELADTKLVDGVSHKPHYSLRTFTLALKYAARNPMGNIYRSLYEGFCLSYLTQLNRQSQEIMRATIASQVLGANAKTYLQRPAPEPAHGRHISVEGYWLPLGTAQPFEDPRYILTETVRNNLKELARAISAGQLPVLIQGETSIGKTSMISYLAKLTGNPCVRINNHEHTDLEDYLGSYQTNESGQLVFREGILVDAVRKGHWIILDELNLAPSEVLEALNRLLDANREIFIAETQTVITAHPSFMLFATQNPPGYYGGRKNLSRAFRNRFIEMHFDELPAKELEDILHRRCDVPSKTAGKMIKVMLELQAVRRKSGVFAGKQSFMTLRDLFRWAERYRLAKRPTKGQFYDFDQHLADHGYLLLSGRVRDPEEIVAVKSAIEKHFKREIFVEKLFTGDANISSTAGHVLEPFMKCNDPAFAHIVWTSNLKRIAVMAGNALAFGEPVLLVGETGCGKTTMCQIYSAMKELKLFGVNCHVNTETSDFLGGLRPARDHSKPGKMFEWKDGPLVEAMKEGGVFLLDEISLAEDSVIERVNSVLEPERLLTLTERGALTEASGVETITSHAEFRFVATMNPGGDYGKKELSPALRNRFTEIWCENLDFSSDLRLILHHNLFKNCSEEAGDIKVVIVEAIAQFVEWCRVNHPRVLISTRDIMAWIHFINKCVFGENSVTLNPVSAYLHSAVMIFETLTARHSVNAPPTEIVSLLKSQIELYDLDKKCNSAFDLSMQSVELFNDGSNFGTGAFSVPIVGKPNPWKTYSFVASGVRRNLLRILRGMVPGRALLLEGSPGVGKTSIVSALAAATGHKLIRINLSEQTDVSELFGSDMPAPGLGTFQWRDGPFLQALKEGSWILLDELNLASQSVLEGLNACLDHRGEIYVPELGMSFKVDSKETRIFACQNPLNQGHGRKGLPKSFLNRFTQIYMEALSSDDLFSICQSAFPNLSSSVLQGMINFNSEIEKLIASRQIGIMGQPWEFNLRDVMRWCEMLAKTPDPATFGPLYLELLYIDRFRSETDRTTVRSLAAERLGFGENFKESRDFVKLEIREDGIELGKSFLKFGTEIPAVDEPCYLLQSQSALLEKLHWCAEQNFVPLLVGKQGCGKSALLQTLAALKGELLDVTYMNSATDAAELLGSFEQWSYDRRVTEIVRRCERLQRSASGSLKSLLSSAGKASSDESVFQKYCLELLLELEKMEETDYLHYAVEGLKNHLVRLVQTGNVGKGEFEWSDSVLVRAITEGTWLLIENANLCSPAVLDRLNSLLEPHGALLLSERGAVNGAVPLIRPHPNFRLFLTMNPAHGELSRAMRNRTIEICVLTPFHPLDNMVLLQDSFEQERDITAAESALEKIQRMKSLSLHDIRELGFEHRLRHASVTEESVLKLASKMWPAMNKVDGESHMTDEVHVKILVPVKLDVERILQAPLELNLRRHQLSALNLYSNIDHLLDCASRHVVVDGEDFHDALRNPFISVVLELFVILTGQPGLLSGPTSGSNSVLSELMQRLSQGFSSAPAALKSIGTIATISEWGSKLEDLVSYSQMDKVHPSCQRIVEFIMHVRSVLLETLRVDERNVPTVRSAALWLRSILVFGHQNRRLENQLKALLWKFLEEFVWRPLWGLPEAFPASIERERLFLTEDIGLSTDETLKAVRSLRKPVPPFREEESYRIAMDLMILRSQICGSLMDSGESMSYSSDLVLQLRQAISERSVGFGSAAFTTVSRLWSLYHFAFCMFGPTLDPSFGIDVSKIRAMVRQTVLHLHELPLVVPDLLLWSGYPDSTIHAAYSSDNVSLYFDLLGHFGKVDEKGLLLPASRLWNQDISSIVVPDPHALSLSHCEQNEEDKRSLAALLWRTAACETRPGDREAGFRKRISSDICRISAEVMGTPLDDPKEAFVRLCGKLPSVAKLRAHEESVLNACQHPAGESVSEFAESNDWIFSGLCFMKLFLPPVVDPEQVEHMNFFCQSYQAAECRGTLLGIQEYFAYLYGSPDERNYNPSLTAFHKLRLQEVEDALSKMDRKKPAFRPHMQNYTSLLDEAIYFNEMALVRVRDYLQLISTSCEDTAKKNGFLKLVEWTFPFSKAIEEYRTKWLAYRDLITEFVLGLQQIIHGIRTAYYQFVSQRDRSIERLTSQALSVCNFRAYSGTSFVSPNNLQEMWEGFTKTLPSGASVAEEDITKAIGEGLLVVSLAMRTSIRRPGRPDIQSDIVRRVFGKIARLWNDLEFKLKVAEAEKEQVYKFVHKDAADADFPTFKDDFAEFVVENQQESAVGKKKPTSLKELSRDIQLKILETHRKAFETRKEFSLSDVYRDCYRIVSEDPYADLPPEWHLMELQLSWSKQEVSTNEASWSFYHDPAVEKAKTCLPLISATLKRAKELLEEWPGNPLLTDVCQVAERVLSLSVHSPLAKLLAGLDLLLSKCQLWEERAHSGVSMYDQMNMLSEKILEWRRLELMEWKSTMDRVKLERSKAAVRWWPYIVSLVEESSREKTVDGNLTVLVRLIREFIEAASLGDFRTRLELVKAIGMQFSSGQKEEELCGRILLNLHGQYSKIEPRIQAEASKLLSPVERDLQEFVKITRWNPDLNYWSLKHTVEKTHKRMLEFMRKIGEALDSRVTFVIQGIVLPSHLVSSSYENKAIFKPKALERPLGLLTELPRYWRRTTKITRQFCTKSMFPELITAVSDFADEALERHRELQKPVERLSKEKHKQETKLLARRKRLAFTTLSKSLKAMGLSWKKGANLSLTRKEERPYAVSVLSADCSSNDPLAALKRSCIEEYHRSLVNLNGFWVLCGKPHDTLPKRELAVMKGFVEHLLSVVVGYWTNVSDASRDHAEMELFLSAYLKEVGSGDQKAKISSSQCRDILEEGYEILLQVVETMEMYGLLIDSVPAQSGPAVLDVIIGPADNHLTSAASRAEAKHIIETLSEESRTLAKTVADTLKDAEQVSGYYARNTLSNLVATLPDIQKQLKVIFEAIPGSLTTRLTGLVDRVEAFDRRCGETSLESSKDAQNTSIVTTAEKAVKTMLRSLQNIMKLSESQSAAEEGHSDDSLLTKQLLGGLKTIFTELKSRKVISALKAFGNASTQVIPDGNLHNAVDTIAAFCTPFHALEERVVADSLRAFYISNYLLNVLLNIFCDLVKEGFGAAEELDDAEQEGQVQFEEAENAGMGSGEGAKDVSDQIESQDQLEDAQKEGTERKEEETKDDIKDEENGIEMDEDFDGAVGDVGKEEVGSEDEGEEQDQDFQDEMGKVSEDEDGEQLDEELWKDEHDNEEEQNGDERETAEDGAKGKDVEEKQELAPGDAAENDNEPPVEDSSEKLPENMNEEQADNTDLNEEVPDASTAEKDDDKMEDDDMMKSDEMDESQIEESQDQDESQHPESEDAMQNGEESKVDDEEKIEPDVPQQPEEQAPDERVPGVEQPQMDIEMSGYGSVDQTAFKTGQTEDQSGADNEMDADEDDVEGDTGLKADGSGPGTTQSVPESSAQSMPKSTEKRSLETANNERTKGDPDQPYQKRLKMSRSTADSNKEKQEKRTAELYEHVKDETEHFDAQTVDAAANEDEMRNQLDKFHLDETKEEPMSLEEEQEELEEDQKTENEKIHKGKSDFKKQVQLKDEQEDQKENRATENGDIDFAETLGVVPKAKSFFDTNIEAYEGPSLMATEKALRSELVEAMASWSQRHFDSADEEKAAMELWRKYEMITRGHALEMSEQLRLVLEPTKKTKLRGDYRTGKRLNMRKVVAYVASEYRKDKIWMRRNQPNQRQYQVMIAVDDSSSMADNRAKELAFESLALISSALTFLDVGELSICSFGEKIELLHPLNQPFMAHDGARVLTRFTFQQKKTNLAEMMSNVAGVFDESRSRLTSTSSVSQLLLIVSDGRGVFREGVEVVKRAIRGLNNMGIFTVFVILDKPGGPNQNSILDIKVPVFGAPGQPLELRSYMQDFPFPFYLILQDMKDLPVTLCDAIRQWFEMIASNQ